MRSILAATLTLAMTTGCSANTHTSDGCSVEETQDGALVTCDDGTQVTIKHGETGEAGGECQIPASTLNMTSMNEEAWRISHVMSERANENYTDCEQSEDQCRTRYLQDSYNAAFYFAVRANVFPLRTCGVEVISVISTMEEYLASDGEAKIHLSVETDLDNDGISNYDEFLMNLNPCTPKSYGCLNDAELDFDADGIPNGQDELPICNWDDPGHWETACI